MEVRIQGGEDIMVRENIGMFATRKQIWTAMKAAVRGYEVLGVPTARALRQGE